MGRRSDQAPADSDRLRDRATPRTWVECTRDLAPGSDIARKHGVHGLLLSSASSIDGCSCLEALLASLGLPTTSAHHLLACDHRCWRKLYLSKLYLSKLYRSKMKQPRMRELVLLRILVLEQKKLRLSERILVVFLLPLLVQLLVQQVRGASTCG